MDYLIYCFSFLNRYELLINFHCYNLFEKWTELPHELLDFGTLESKKCTLCTSENNIMFLLGNRSFGSWPQWCFPALFQGCLLNKKNVLNKHCHDAISIIAWELLGLSLLIRSIKLALIIHDYSTCKFADK